MQEEDVRHHISNHYPYLIVDLTVDKLRKDVRLLVIWFRLMVAAILFILLFSEDSIATQYIWISKLQSFYVYGKLVFNCMNFLLQTFWLLLNLEWNFIELYYFIVDRSKNIFPTWFYWEPLSGSHIIGQLHFNATILISRKTIISLK